MAYQPHYIAAYEDDSGLNTYYEPFLIPEKAFPVLEDAYCWRGKVQKRRGYNLLGRLRKSIVSTTPGIGNVSSATLTYNIFALITPHIVSPESTPEIHPGTVANPLVITIAAPISQTLTDDGSNPGYFAIAPAGLITSATINYNTGDVVLTFSGPAAASATTISGFYWPGLPVMGLRSYEQKGINTEKLIAFDQKYAYQYNAGLAEFEDLTAAHPVTWQGSNSNFFWSTNYTSAPVGGKGLFWLTNTNMGAARDFMYYYDGADWHIFIPDITTNPPSATHTQLCNAEIILPYRGRLIFLNTWEGVTGMSNAATLAAATNFPQRIRWSANASPLGVTAFRDDIIGQGGFLDIPTNEVLISAEFIKDVMVIKFEHSSYKLVSTNNESDPFDYQKINTELGSESKFSLVPFDRGVYSVGDAGILTDDSVNVERIDLQIPNTIFNFQATTNGTVRVHGIRDYFNELVFWCYPNTDFSPTFPDQVLVYNYRNETYAIFNDSFTCFGYFLPPAALTWAQTFPPWASWNTPWNAPSYQALFPQVIAGNQDGFVETLTQSVFNAPSLALHSINFALAPIQFTIPNHNLQVGDIIKITGILGDPSVLVLNNLSYKVVTVISPQIVVLDYFDTVTDTFLDPTPLVNPASVYIGGGLVTYISGINISTKVFVPFYEQGQQCRVGYIDFLLDRTGAGQITSDIFVNENSTFSVTDPATNPSLMGTNVVLTTPENTALYPCSANQKKIWHRQFVQTLAQNFQIQLTISDVQRASQGVYESDVVLHAMAIYLSPNARLAP